jgi:hypothetical protein
MKELCMPRGAVAHAVLALLAFATLPAAWALSQTSAPFFVRVIDEQTGRGVPLVELKTVNNVRYVTDSAGIAAIDEPGLEGQRVFFYVSSHGYEFPADGFGFRGVAMPVIRGESSTIKIKRQNVAERLYRVTGAGIYRDTLLARQEAPTARPVLNAQVFGSDSVVNAYFRGKLYWFWGDTHRAAYPLGNFHVPGAVSRLPGQGGLDPAVGVDLEYFVGADGFARPMAQMEGAGPTWIDGLTVLRDESGQERMFAGYVKVRNQLEVYARGIVEYDAGNERFQKAVDVPLDAPVAPGGHPLIVKEAGQDFVYFARAYPLTRVKAAPESFLDPGQYEAYTCLAEGSRMAAPQIDRDAQGRARYGWKRKTPAVGPAEQQALVKQGLLKPNEGLLQMRDVESGKPVSIHAGTVAWNAFRERYVMIAVQTFGSSMLGEVWFAEAETPVGPWAYARKVVTHQKYSFYNPKQHPIFDADGGKRIYFEGTYAATFSGNDDPTPRYDYNQIMYRLDLEDPRLVLPVAMYDVSSGRRAEFAWHGGTKGALDAAPLDRTTIAFFAGDRPFEGLLPIGWVEANDKGRRLTVVSHGSAPGQTAFYAMSPGVSTTSDAVVPLYEWREAGGAARAWITADQTPPAGYQRAGAPLCLVWRSPWN